MIPWVRRCFAKWNVCYFRTKSLYGTVYLLFKWQRYFTTLHSVVAAKWQVQILSFIWQENSMTKYSWLSSSVGYKIPPTYQRHADVWWSRSFNDEAWQIASVIVLWSSRSVWRHPQHCSPPSFSLAYVRLSVCTRPSMFGYFCNLSHQTQCLVLF